eukprot:TRINITY_DN3307_c0_g1_i3.p1 TRINITY_DN3307_c0_g1~~TRINITY_DN3307_c0_g1_i3.p1  ORF type:complete len:958 (+),score=155.65 TRINITY_DN3307_c0_g1_i3:139-3012(+)
MEDLERAVHLSLVAGNEVDQATRNNALLFCENFKNSPQSWKFCLELIFNTTSLVVQIFCFGVLQEQILHRHETLDSNEKLHLRKGLMTFLQTKLIQPGSQASLKNKYSQILVLLFKAEYPSEWPTFFTELQSLINSPMRQNGISDSAVTVELLDIWMRIISNIDQEIVSADVHSKGELSHNSLIKDQMKIDCVQDISNTWYMILSRFYSSRPDLAEKCLSNIKAFIGWIDLSLIVNNRFLPLLYSFFTDSELREETSDVFYEIVSRGMDSSSKIDLLASLNLCPILASLNADDTDFLTKIARLISRMGEILLHCVEQVPSEKSKGQLSDCLQLMFKYMNHPDYSVSHQALAFASLYLNSIKKLHKLGQITNDHVEHLKLYLQIIRNKLKYDDTFDFENTKEQESLVRYRMELSNLFKGITQILPELVASFVRLQISNIPKQENISLFSPYDIEVSIYLFYLMGEGLPDAVVKNTKSFFNQVIIDLTDSCAPGHPHRCVTQIYFETVTRYAKYFENKDYLIKILKAFVDHRGILHPHSAVRSRCCYLFTRFVKVLKPQLLPILPDIIACLTNLLTFQNQNGNQALEFKDQMSLLESIGLLIADTNQQYIPFILTPLCDKLSELVAQKPYKQDTEDNPVYTNLLCQIIFAIGTFSKGFPLGLNLQPATAETFGSTFQLILIALRDMPRSLELRSKVVFFFHRMVLLLGDQTFRYLEPALPILMVNCGGPDLLTFIALINQMIGHFKEKFEPMIDRLFLPLVNRISEYTTGQVTSDSEEEREKLEIKKHYYLFINTLSSNKLATILVSPVNVSNFETIWRSIVEGCYFFRDVTIQRLSFSTIRNLILTWGTPGADWSRFTEIIFNDVNKAMFAVPLDNKFNLSDLASDSVINEIAQIQKMLLSKLGNQFIELLKDLVLPSMQFNNGNIQVYTSALGANNAQDFRKFLREFLTAQKDQIRY